MIYFRFILIIFFFYTLTTKANEVEIVDLHKNKTFDQLVLESNQNDENNINKDQIEIENNNESISEDDNSLNLQDNIDQLNEDSEDSDDLDKNRVELVNKNEKAVSILIPENIFELDDILISKHFENINEIKSKTIHREFIKILSDVELEDPTNINDKIYFIIKKLYEIGEIGKAYNLIKSIDLNNISNKDNLYYFYQIEINYLTLNTF